MFAVAHASRHPDTGSNPLAPPAPPLSLSAKVPAGSHSKRASPRESSARAPLLQSVFPERTPAARAGNPESALQSFASSLPVYFLHCFPANPPLPRGGRSLTLKDSSIAPLPAPSAREISPEPRPEPTAPVAPA